MKTLLGVLLLLVAAGVGAEPIPFDSDRWVGISCWSFRVCTTTV